MDDHTPIPSSSREPRNIVLCFDGTGDWIGTDRTNVARLFAALAEDPALCYYDGGVGTLVDYNALSAPRRAALKILDLANGIGLREKALQGYRFLVRNYQDGDRIYLFGFSRGAYTARLVAAMVQSFSVVRPSAENVVPYLWQAFVAPGGFDVFKQGAKRLKAQFAPPNEAKVHFMGLFDTVSSVGLLSRFNVYPFTRYNQGVLRTCHAVSVDESRNMFPADLMDPAQPNLSEVWFPGVHRDVGGGLPPGRARIADEALDWIATESERSGLRLRPWDRPDVACAPLPNESAFDLYAFAGTVPLQIPTEDVGGKRYHWPNFRSVRAIPENALIHEIALAAYDGGRGRPANFPKGFVAFKTGDETRTSESACLPPTPRWPDELVVHVFGATLLLFSWDAIVGSALGPWWPITGSWLEVAAVLLVVPVQGIGRAAIGRLPTWLRFNPARLLPWTAAVTLLVALLVNGPKPLFVDGVGLGTLVFGLANLGRGPALRVERALPYVLFAAIASAVLVGACALLARQFPGLRPSPILTIALGSAALLTGSAAILRDRRRMERRSAR